MLMPTNAEIFHEGQKVDTIYFLGQGQCGFVLSSRLEKFKYIDFNQGQCFGAIDIIGSLLKIKEQEDLDYMFENWMEFESRLFR